MALEGVAVVEEEEDLDGELDGWMMFEGRSVGAVVNMGTMLRVCVCVYTMCVWSFQDCYE